MMWNINDVHVGYGKDLAKQFKLEGSDKRDRIEMLPKLSVDVDIPYSI